MSKFRVDKPFGLYSKRGRIVVVKWWVYNLRYDLRWHIGGKVWPRYMVGVACCGSLLAPTSVNLTTMLLPGTPKCDRILWSIVGNCCVGTKYFGFDKKLIWVVILGGLI